MRTKQAAASAASSTFTQLKRRDQFVSCAIDAIVEVGFSATTVAEVARRAGVSKGVVTYHFAAKNDLIHAVITHVIDSIRQFLEPRLRAAEPARYPERFVAAYLTAWVDYYRTHLRDVLALYRISIPYRDESGRPSAEFGAEADEIAMVERVLKRGQEACRLGPFDAQVVALTMKAALNRLLIRLAADPDLDLEGYGIELVRLFERATRAEVPAA